ncbi:MAG TPA: GNAT family N-acetyltransferase [Caulobacteraceae bacterium]|nr:GNAT family N-acetyltransferase [Caulobacteraceae bacterium]
MKLEAATAADAGAMAAVHAASFDEPWDANEISALLEGPGGFAQLAREARTGIVAAFILARAIADEAEVLTLAVDPAHRRAGVGRALVEAAAVVAAAAGARRLFLEVASDNDAALALYRSAGFAEAGQRPAYYRRGTGAVDALVLRRDLNRPPA